MKDSERLTIVQKEALARKYEKLNALLAQKKRVEDQINAIGQQMNDLRKEANDLDDRFHKLVIEVAPTEVIDLKKKVRQAQDPLEQEIRAKLKQGLSPKLVEKIRALLEGDV